VLLACPTCGARVSARWLFLALPWSKYACASCGSVFTGTVLRLVVTSLAAGVVGYVTISVIKGGMSPSALVLPVAVGLAVFVLRLPGQLRKLD
jgi:hypothetical protein